MVSPMPMVENDRMSNQEMWESRYRNRDQHTPEGVAPHPVVMGQAEAVIARAVSSGGSAGNLRAADLGSGAGRHALALAGLGMHVTAVDFASSAHDLVQQMARERGVADKVTPVAADVSSWKPGEATGFDVIVAAYLHVGLALLTDSAHWLAPGGRLVWIGHAPDSPHGPPAEVVRDSLADHRRQLEQLHASQWRVLRLDEHELNPEFLDVIAVVERSAS